MAMVVPDSVKNNTAARWLLRNLSTEFGLPLIDLEAASGFTRRSLLKSLKLLREEDLVLCHQQTAEDGGALPSVYTRTYSLAGMRLANSVLRMNAAPALQRAAREAIASRNEYLDWQSYRKRRSRRERIGFLAATQAAQAEQARAAQRREV